MSNQLDEATRERIAKQLICRHEHVSGGNDFIECADCDLVWDYGKLTPLIALKMFNHPITKI